MPNYFQIKVCPNGTGVRWGNRLPILENCFPVRFNACQARATQVAGELLSSKAENQFDVNTAAPISTLKVASDEELSREDKLFETTVQFTDDRLGLFPFRRRRLRAKIAVQPKILSLCSGERALPITESEPVRPVYRKDGVSHPLLQWRREISGDTESRLLGACFIFDDPNASSGGSLVYEESRRMLSYFQIRVCPNRLGARWGNLLPILENLFPVRFSACGERPPEIAGDLLSSEAENQFDGNNAAPISTLKVANDEGLSSEDKLFETTVQFTDNRLVPFPFRGRRLRAKIAVQPKILSLRAGEQALAVTESGPVWSVYLKDGVSHFRSAFALPVIPTHSSLKDVLNEERFFEILPLLQWLREISGDTASRPLEACFIFDDPNLHWKRYGFVDFQQIAKHAERENYHVSFATIPLDAWFAHQSTAEIFRKNTSRLSLAIHGNNHTRCELARTYTPEQRASLLNQAIRRIRRFEANTGLQVSRVMVPPHGACSEEMLAALPHFGFESACVSHGSLRAYNKTRPWTHTLGYVASEMIRGCPVFPRWPFASNSTNAILLAAFLRQRIILRGHHHDLKSGIELLDEHARFINSLGSVSWSNLTELSRSNYHCRSEGTTCTLRAMGRNLKYRLPEGLTHLTIESPHNGASVEWRIFGINGSSIVVRDGETVPLSGASTGEISIRWVSPIAVTFPFSEASARLTSSVLCRRLLSEGRDRLLPW